MRSTARGREAEELLELRLEVSELRRANAQHGPRIRSSYSHAGPRRPIFATRRRYRRRRLLAVAAVATVVAVVLVASGLFAGSRSLRPPDRTALAGMSLSQRIVALADSQVGYATNPSGSYCNKFSAYWNAGSLSCPGGEASEQWCADFAAWAWRKAGVPFAYGYGPGEINAGAVSFYEWGVTHGRWHPASSGYKAAPGDVAVYGLRLGAIPAAAHVAIVVDDPPGQRGPDVINGDGDRTGFSVVETGSDQVRADSGHGHAVLAGYVSPE